MINKRKHNKQITTESSFEFTVSSRNKPILIASGRKLFFKRKKNLTENWICSNYQKHKCRASAITETNGLIETRGEPKNDISAQKLDARNAIKLLKDLSERFTPTVAVAKAVLPVKNDLVNHFALPIKDKLIRTPARKRKQLDVNMPPITVARKFEISQNFENGMTVDQIITSESFCAVTSKC